MTDQPRRQVVLLATVAAVATGAGLMLGIGLLPWRGLDGGLAPGVGWLAVGCTLAALAEFARLQVRVGPDGEVPAELTWGEASFVILCAVLPAGWVPAAVLVGVGGAHTALGLFDQRRTVTMILRATTTLTVAATAGVLVTRLIARTYHSELTLRAAAALVAGALVYALVTMALTTLQLMDAGVEAPTLFTRLLASKLLMLLGNVTTGLLVIAVEGAGMRWLVVLLPPVAWLLQQAYGYRLRLDDERWTWQQFSDTTRDLNRLDERDAAVAGIRGALRLFPAIAAEVVVHDLGGGNPRAYSAERGCDVADGPLRPQPTGSWRRPAPVEPRQLLVGDAPVGELRLRLARPVRFSRRDRHMLAAYGDALAAALHDAATHEELRAIAERSSYDAVHDPLTGFVNRTALLANGAALLRAQAADAPVALLMLDVNHFKEVNNTLGYGAGDELLQIVAVRLASMVDPTEPLARLGGDEFAVLLPQTPLEKAVERARRLAAEIAAPTEVASVVLSVEASVGVAAAEAGSVTMAELLRRADIAMYQAKQAAQQVSWYDPARDQASVDRLALLAEVRIALKARDQLVLVLQPVVDLHTGRPVGAEVLVRWDHPRRGRLAPGEFLDAVEHSELVGAFTRYVLERALELAGSWVADGAAVPIAVNLSARSLLDAALAEDLPRLLHRHSVPAGLLTLEITESVVLTEQAVVERVLAALRAVGVRLAVDDFGSGFSSLTFLARVAVDEVKIDRTFVARMVESPEAEAIVRATVDLGDRLGVRVVAEGVETAAQRDKLRELGCSVAQGYHFYRPLAPRQAADVLRNGGPPPQLPDTTGPSLA